MGLDGLSEGAEVVAALQHRHDPSRVLVSQLQNLPGHVREIAVLEQQPAKGVAPPRIESCRDDDEIGWQFLLDDVEPLDKDFAVQSSLGSGAQRNVQVESFALAFASLVQASRAGVIRILMRREIKDRWIAIKDVLGAIAVMDIPIDDYDPFRSVSRLSISGAYRGVVEQAKPHRCSWSRMMSRGPHQSKGINRLPGHDGVDCRYGCSGGEPRDFKRFRADYGIHVQKRLAGLAQALDMVDQARTVAASNVLIFSRTRRYLGQRVP